MNERDLGGQFFALGERRKDNQRRQNSSFEPFSREPEEDDRFVNCYTGPFHNRLELNRRAVEGVIETAALKGRVVLFDIPADRFRTIGGVNRDGSVSLKRSIFWHEKSEVFEEKRRETSYALVNRIPVGWSIGICGEGILEDLTVQADKKLLDRRFASVFNRQVKGALQRATLEEKFKVDPYYHLQALLPVAAASTGIFYSLGENDLAGTVEWGYFPFVFWGISNLITSIFSLSAQQLPGWGGRSLKSKYEYFMPKIEIDRAARGLAYLNGKGRNLVRVAPG